MLHRSRSADALLSSEPSRTPTCYERIHRNLLLLDCHGCGDLVSNRSASIEVHTTRSAGSAWKPSDEAASTVPSAGCFYFAVRTVLRRHCTSFGNSTLTGTIAFMPVSHVSAQSSLALSANSWRPWYGFLLRKNEREELLVVGPVGDRGPAAGTQKNAGTSSTVF